MSATRPFLLVSSSVTGRRIEPMSHRNGIVHGIALGLLALGLAALAARADWRVTNDGGRMETKATWQIKGKLVVFTRADNDALASLRASAVYLDASPNASAPPTV